VVPIRVTTTQPLLRIVCTAMEIHAGFGARGGELRCDLHGCEIVIVLPTVLLRCWPGHRLINECVLWPVCFAQERARKATGGSVTIYIVPLTMETCIVTAQTNSGARSIPRRMQSGTLHAYPSHDMRISTSSSLPPLFGSLGNQSP